VPRRGDFPITYATDSSIEFQGESSTTYWQIRGKIDRVSWYAHFTALRGGQPRFAEELTCKRANP
jgi:hypothetical protein